jgi:glycosyltransferase involved in cell wall biosynthesis
MHFDVVFLDTTANKYYDRKTLDTQPLGGTEASVVRVAEGLGSLGLKVAVVQSNVGRFEPQTGEFAFFLHADEMADMSCGHFVQIRDHANSHLFPTAKKYLWCHDTADSYRNVDKLKEDIRDYGIKVITVSDWHNNDMSQLIGTEPSVNTVYNPVPESVYKKVEDRPKYDQNLLIWMSSPHKGLGKALDLFAKIVKERPKLKLVVFNPGYYKLNPDIQQIPNVFMNDSGSKNCHTLWHYVQRSLAVFYPTDYKETFGCIAAEANALGTPLITYKNAGLAESVSSDDQFITNDDEVLTKIDAWQKERPVVSGKEEFKQANVILEWVKLLAD